MSKKLYTLDEAKKLIEEKHFLVISADSSLMRQLPKGNWIGGTTPYSMTENGGLFSKELLFINDFTKIGINFKIKQYCTETIDRLCSDSFSNGFTILIATLDSSVLKHFALNSLTYSNIFQNPIIGYACGFDTQAIEPSYAYLGTSKQALRQDGVAIHIELPEYQAARVEIINPNVIDESSPSFVFPIDSFVQSDCLIDGEHCNFARYLEQNGMKTNQLPLIANCNGALLTRDFKNIDVQEGVVSFYAPVYANETYRMAKPVENYLELFKEKLQVDQSQVIFACLCVSFYKLANLSGQTINISGPFTFGEIAYQLLNQTATYLMIDSQEDHNKLR